MNIILTGTSSGFGLLTAQTLAKQGHTVFATMRNVTTKNAAAASALQAWAQAQAASVHIVELDATSDNSVQQAIAFIAAHTNNKIDVLINNAGAAFIGLNETLSAEQTNQIFQINVIAADRMIKAVLPYMHAQHSGLLVTLSSVASRQYIPAMGAYCASKAAIDALSLSYAYELKGTGIEVTIVQPGAYPATDIVSKQAVPENPDAERFYSDALIRYKEGIFHHFEPKPDSPDPVEVAQKIAALVSLPKGERPLWSLVGAGPLTGMISDLNETIQQLTDIVLGGRI